MAPTKCTTDFFTSLPSFGQESLKTALIDGGRGIKVQDRVLSSTADLVCFYLRDSSREHRVHISGDIPVNIKITHLFF